MLYPAELRAPASDIAVGGPAEQARRGFLMGLGATAALAAGGGARAAEAGLERLAPYPVLRLSDGAMARLVALAPRARTQE